MIFGCQIFSNFIFKIAYFLEKWSYDLFIFNERYNPGLSFKTTEDLTNVLPGKILQLKSQKGRCQKVCDFEK